MRLCRLGTLPICLFQVLGPDSLQVAWFTGFRFDLLLKVHPFAYDWAGKLLFIEWFAKQVDVYQKFRLG